MFKKIIIGVDGEDGGRDAIALGKALGSSDSQLILAHVYLQEPVAWRGFSAPYDEVLREDATKLLETARAEAEIEATLQCHASPAVGRGLHELAEQLEADLLVVGSSRRGLLGRVRNADDTRHALNGSPCPVAMAPVGYGQSSEGIHRIGVAYDESAESEHALAFARQLAAEHSASLAACQVLYFPARLAAGPAFPSRSTIAQLMTEARDRMGALQGVEPHTLYGDPAEELSQFSDAQDLLVVGSRGYGPIGRLVYGSTSQRLARRARCPLLVLTRRSGGEKGAAEAAAADLAHAN